jgi:hypothetical protein
MDSRRTPSDVRRFNKVIWVQKPGFPLEPRQLVTETQPRQIPHGAATIEIDNLRRTLELVSRDSFGARFDFTCLPSV